MGKFKVGDRARINCPDSSNHGDEVTVLACGVHGESLGRHYIGYEVSVVILLGSSAGKNCIFEEHELEPILPPKEFSIESELSRIFGHEVSIGPDFQPRPRVSA